MGARLSNFVHYFQKHSSCSYRTVQSKWKLSAIIAVSCKFWSLTSQTVVARFWPLGTLLLAFWVPLSAFHVVTLDITCHCTYIALRHVSLRSTINCTVAVYIRVALMRSSRLKRTVDNQLHVVNAIKDRLTSSWLLLATFAVMDKFLSGYRRKDRGNEAGSNKKQRGWFKQINGM